MSARDVKETLRLLEEIRGIKLPASYAEAELRSFAYGNAKIENQGVTRETVDREAEKLRRGR